MSPLDKIVRIKLSIPPYIYMVAAKGWTDELYFLYIKLYRNVPRTKRGGHTPNYISMNAFLIRHKRQAPGRRNQGLGRRGSPQTWRISWGDGPFR